MSQSDPQNESFNEPVPEGPDGPPSAPNAEPVETGPREHVRAILSSVDDQVEVVRTIQIEQEAQAGALDERERIIAENERTLATERRGVLERAQELDRLQAALEDDRAAMEEDRRAWQQRIADERAGLERDLEALHELRAGEDGAPSGDVAELAAQRAALEEAQLRLRQRADALEAEVTRRGEDVDNERRRADDLQRELEAAREQCDRLRAAEPAADAGDQERIQALERELETAREKNEESAGKLDDAQAMLSRLNSRLQSLQSQAESKPAPAPEADVGATMRVRAMQQRIYRLEEQLEQAEAKADEQASSAATELSEQQLAMLREKASLLAEVAEHLRRRQHRLKAIRRHLSVHGRAEGPSRRSSEERQAEAYDEFERRAQQMREIEAARQTLVTRSQEMARTEKKMIRRWARSKAIVLTGWLALLAVFAASLSWLIVDRVVPATVSGTVTLEAKARLRGKLTAEEAQQWQTWHAGLVGDEQFRQTLAKRMDERRLERYATLASVSATLDEHLTLDTTEPTKIVLTLAGTRSHEMLSFLDILGSTIAAESLRQARKRTDQAWAVVKNERKKDGNVTYSSLNRTPISDYRLHAIGPVFVVVFGAMIAVVMFICKRLLRVKREFDDDGSLFEAGAAA